MIIVMEATATRREIEAVRTKLVQEGFSVHLSKGVDRTVYCSGADGIMVEVHPAPGEVLSDGKQSLTPENFRSLVAAVKDIALAVGRSIPEVGDSKEWGRK